MDHVITVNRPPLVERYATQERGPASETMRQFQALRRVIDATGERIWRFSDLDPHIRNLEQMIFTLDDNELMAEMFLSGLSDAQIALQQVAYCQWETQLERLFLDKLQSRASIDEYPLAARFRRLILREVDLISGAQNPRRVLFIGSGPFPISAIFLHEFLRVPIDCADSDGTAVEQSTALLRRLGLADRIRVYHRDGVDVAAGEYDLVVIALLAKPKSEILRGLAASSGRGCKVICRTSGGLRVLVYEPMRMERDLKAYVVAGQRLAKEKGDTISSLLLEKQSGEQ